MAESSESMVIASIAAWFTPAVLFCVMNLIIATIYIASNHNNNKHLNNHAHNDPFTRITRMPSFFERAKSMNSSSYTTTTTTTTGESQNRYQPPFKSTNYSSSSRLAQSIHCSSIYQTPPELPIGNDMSRSNSERNIPSSLLERVKSIKFSSINNGFQTESEQISNSLSQLVRVDSFLDRVKSFKISNAFKSGDASSQPENVDLDHHVIRSKSETKITDKKSLVEMKKSRSEMRIAPDDDDEDVDLRRPATARERRNAIDEEIDAKADDFITRFKQQLKLQRIESLVRYRDMMNRRI